MTVTHRKRQQPEELQIVNEPGVQIECDGCSCDLTHSVRIKCADEVCEDDDGVDICPSCFCNGKEFAKHKRWHDYRVVELHSYPIFSEDWGADEELLLLEGVSLQGLGNWQAIAEHIGTRTKEEVEEHYNSVYVDSPDWPLPRMDLEFSIDPNEFQERKRRRIATLNTNAPPPPKAVTSAPGVHEIATFLPGRLEFEHELDNDAEDLIKDLEFGVCQMYDGDQIVEDENDPDVKARQKMKEEAGGPSLGGGGSGHPGMKAVVAGKGIMNGMTNGKTNGHGHGHRGVNGTGSKSDPRVKNEDEKMDDGSTADGENAGDEATQPLPFETPDSVAFKLTLIEMYMQRVAKRHEAKAIMFDRGLLENKKMQAADKKRPKEERDIVNRLRPFAKLQTAQDYEEFVTDILYEHLLRKRIQELQLYRRLGLRTAADIEQYDLDLAKRAKAKEDYSKGYYSSERLQQLRAVSGRGSSGPDPRRASVMSEDRRSRSREPTPGRQVSAQQPSASGTGPPQVRKMPAPLNLANSPSLHLLTPAEQTLCSQLRILPKPYLVIKETLVREYARRGGKLRRREARDLVKIDVNKTSRVWDFLVQAGYLRINQEPSTSTAQDNTASTSTSQPQRDGQGFVPPKPPSQTIGQNGVASSSSQSIWAPQSIPPPGAPTWPG